MSNVRELFPGKEIDDPHVLLFITGKSSIKSMLDRIAEHEYIITEKANGVLRSVGMNSTPDLDAYITTIRSTTRAAGVAVINIIIGPVIQPDFKISLVGERQVINRLFDYYASCGYEVSRV